MNMPIEIISAIKNTPEEKTNDSTINNNMKTPNEIISAVKDNSEEKIDDSIVDNETSILDKITASYNNINNEIANYNDQIKSLRNDADKLKEEIHLKKNIKNKNIDEEGGLDKKKQLKKKIEINNYSINEETCNTAIDQINNIRSNISVNSKAASELLIPLEESFDLLKTQVEYTILLENILDLFNKKNKFEKKINESDQIIAMLAESLEI